MANHASALKAHRQSLRRRSRNRSNRGTLRTALKGFADQIKDVTPAGDGPSVAQLHSLVDKAAHKRALSKNAAARQKSRLTRRLNKSLANQAGK